MDTIVRRILLILVLPFVLPAKCIYVLFRESGRAWWHAWNETMMEIDSAKYQWNRR